MSFSTIAAALLLAAGGAGIGNGIQNILETTNKVRRDDYIQRLQDQYGMSSADARAFLENYSQDTWNLFNPLSWGKSNDPYDWASLEKDYQDYLNWKDQIGPLPELPDYDAIDAQTKADLDEAYGRIYGALDTNLARSTENFQNQLAENAASFNDYRNQLLTNNAMSQNQIAGSARYELARQQRNAIARGASAAQRLVANINTQLGLQNKSAQQALETSNNLAQQLLAQRQAASGIRSDYQATLNADTTARADASRSQLTDFESLRDSRRGAAEDRFSNQQARWDDVLNAHADNPWSKYARNTAYQNKYNGN